MNYYLTAFEGMKELLKDSQDAMKNFQRDIYPKAFEQYCSRHADTLLALENGYLQVIDKNQFLINMAEELARSAKEQLDAQPKKNAKEKLAADLNMCLVAYTIPAILETKNESAKPFSEEVLASWKKHFPKTNLKAADFEQINSGFERKFCYITTAVCQTLGKPDDCYELNLFRSYRDNYLMKREDGEALVHEYYDLAPTIIKHINRHRDSEDIYKKIWKHYLSPCLTLIENGQNEECMDLYISMVRDMQTKYFHEA